MQCVQDVTPCDNPVQLDVPALKALEAQCGKTFALAAYCTGANEASVFPEVCSDFSFLDTDCAGKHVWLNMPRDRVLEYLQHYRACKKKDPHHTSACILVPMWRARRCAWRPLIKDMLLLRDFKHGSVPCLTAEPRDKARSWFVYYDAPTPIFKVSAVSSTTDESLLMQFSGVVGGQPAEVVADSGSTNTFMTSRYAGMGGFTVKP